MLARLEFKATCPICGEPDNIFIADVVSEIIEDDNYTISSEVIECCNEECAVSFVARGKVIPKIRTATINWIKP